MKDGCVDDELTFS